MNALRAKLDMTEASLMLSQQKVEDQEKLLDLSRKETADIVKNYESQIRKEREDRALSEDKLRCSLSECNEKLFTVESQLSEAESKIKNQQIHLNALKENVTQLKADNRHSAIVSDQRLEEERKRHQNILQDQEALNHRMVAAVKAESEDTEKALRKRISELQQTNSQLEEQISTQNTNLISERTNSDEAMRKLRATLQEEHQASMDQVQQRLRATNSEKNDLQKQIAVLSSDLNDAQAMRSATNVEIEGFRRTVQNLQQQISSKDADTAAEVGRVRSDMQKRINQLEEECSQHSSLREKIVELETKLADTTGRHREILEDKNKEIERLGENLRRVEDDIERIREDEAQRAAVLQSAILNYVQGSKLRSTSPRK